MMAIDNYAPVVLFTYCRPANTKETVEHLRKNEEALNTDLIIYSDAPKNEMAEEGVRLTREYIHTVGGFKSVTIIERKNNLGLANSIVDGVTSVINKYGRVIVLEDDLNVSPYFLKYMNEGLRLYEKNDKIISIHGYVYPVKKQLPEAFLIKGADCWGWATWKRGWDLFSFDAKSLYRNIVDARREREFDFNFSYPYIEMLKGQIGGEVNSWAICWYASAFLKDKYTIYPKLSLVCHNDYVSEGSTHGTAASQFNGSVLMTPIDWEKAEVEKESLIAREEFENFFNSMKSLTSKRENLIKKVGAKVSKWFFSMA